jgi:hypothetical protein
MALQISGTNVVDNSRNLANIESFLSTVKSVWANFTLNLGAGNNLTLGNRTVFITSGNNCTVTLPTTSLTQGLEVIVGGVGSSVTSITVNPGVSERIMGLALGETLVIDVPNTVVKFIYVGGTFGWSIL